MLEDSIRNNSQLKGLLNKVVTFIAKEKEKMNANQPANNSVFSTPPITPGTPATSITQDPFSIFGAATAKNSDAPNSDKLDKSTQTEQFLVGNNKRIGKKSVDSNKRRRPDDDTTTEKTINNKRKRLDNKQITSETTQGKSSNSFLVRRRDCAKKQKSNSTKEKPCSFGTSFCNQSDSNAINLSQLGRFLPDGYSFLPNTAVSSVTTNTNKSVMNSYSW